MQLHCTYQMKDDLMNKLIRRTLEVKRVVVGQKTTDGVSCLITLMDSINEEISMTFARRRNS